MEYPQYSEERDDGQGQISQQNMPYVIQQSKADLLDKIRPDAIVEITRHKLMGEDFTNGKWVKNPAYNERAISEIGAWDISNLMLTASSQNVSISSLNDKEIKMLTLNIIRAAHDMMLKNWKVYGIKGIDQIHFVHTIVFTNTLITLKQPEGEGIRKLLKGTTTEVRQYSAYQQEKQGWFPSVAGLWKRR